MKANLIKTLKNTAEIVDIEAGKTARANFPGVDFENAVLIINGKISNPDTIIKNHDIVTLRQIPADANDTDNWWLYTFVIPFGFIIQPAVLSYTARQQAEDAERELEKIKKLTNSADIDNSPFLRGASNTIATGKSQPYFCGRNFLTPYLFSQPFYKISGTDGATQEVYNILECGFKGIVINKLGIGDTVIKTFSDSKPQNGVFSIDEGIFANGQLEIRQDGSLFSTLTELNRKIKSNVINQEIAKEYEVTAGTKEHTIITLDPNAKDVDICINFPYGLYTYNDNNDRIKAEVTITPEYSLDGGSTWTQFTFNQNGTQSNVFNRSETKSMRFIAHHAFTLADYQALVTNNQTYVLIRLRSNAPDDQKTRADCYLYYYQSHVFDPLKSSTPAGVIDDGGTAGLVDCLNVEDKERAYSCIAGFKLTATTNNEKKLTQINIIATSTARTWNGSAWSETKAPTRNPAAIALEIYTSDIHPASKYSDSEIDGEIDLDAFGALYKYCDDNDIYFDDLITQAQKKDAEIQRIADVCGCAFYKDIYGRISVAIDQAQENAIAVYNPQNIISLTNKKTFARRVDALRIKYIDSTNDTFKQNTYTVTRLENGQPVTIDENSIIKEIDVKGITTQAQVVKYARRLMAIDELRPITTTLKIGAEGVYFTPYAKIGIQDPSINRDAQDAVVASVTYKSGLLKKITLKNPVTFTDPLKLYGVVINTVNANGAVPIALKVNGTGTTRELEVITKYTAAETHQPAANNVVSFGELDENGEFTKITHEYIITRIARTDGGFNLDLQEYNEAIYDAGLIPAYKPLVNNTPKPAAGEIPSNSVTHEELDKVVTSVNSDAVQAAVDTIQKGYRFTNIYKVRPVDMSLEDIIAKMDDDARNASASISISEDAILLKVEDLDEQQRAFISLTKSQILAQVDDMAQELTGLINVQAGAVTALVEGGGATGQMSLSLELPVIIDATTRAKFVQASTEEKVAAVYAQLEGTSGAGIRYAIKGNASNAAVKALWDDAVAGALIASQIDLSATQIHINAQNVQIDGETIINNAKKIKAAMIDVDNILTKNITIKDQGVLHSSNYNGTIDANGNITAYGSSGWAIDHAGKSDFVDINATGGTFNKVSVSGFIGASGLDFILDPGTIEQFYISHRMGGGVVAVDGQYIVIPFKGRLNYRMEMYDNSAVGTGDTVYKFYLNGNVYKSFAYPKNSERHIFEGEINLNFGDELKCQMENAGGRVSKASFYVRFYANSENYFLNMINKSQIKNI